VRSGFGIFYDQLLPKYYVFSGSSIHHLHAHEPTNPPFPNALQGFQRERSSLRSSRRPNGGCPAGNLKANLQTVNYDCNLLYHAVTT